MRYQRRRNLAGFYRYPEGYEFQLELASGHQQSVILLTPPDLIAVRQQDGTWTRDARTAADGPAPYTEQWYADYLRANNLPLWFMRPEHASCALYDAEARWLNLQNVPSATNTLPPNNYLETRYAYQPQYPRPEIAGNGLTYSYQLTKQEVLRVARRFPATVASSMNNQYRIFVTPEGYIILRPEGRGQNELTHPQGEMEWLPESAENIRASYRIDGGYDAVARPESTLTRNRTAEIAGARAAGHLVDLQTFPHGLGTWTWLNPAVDAGIAAGLNLNTPIDVVIARMNGGLAHLRQGDTPITVFTPNPRFLNPSGQPRGYGRWEYLTTGGNGSSEELAWLNFGGQAHFPINNQPSAADMANLRRNYQYRLRTGEVDEDYTSEIDLVWIPMDAPEDDEDDQDEETGSETSEGATGRDAVDPDTGEVHEPLNRGENNQTGPRGARWYQTRILEDGNKYTVDRTRAHAGTVEPHKSWIVTKRGYWQQYRNYASVDWTDKNSVEKMNKWREQAFARNGWPTKRRDARNDYTEEQRDWFWTMVKEKKGERPEKTIKQLTELFNKKFTQKRSETGITAIVDRLRDIYRQYGEAGKPKPERRRQEEEEEEEDEESEEE